MTIRVSTAIQLILFDMKIRNIFTLMADTGCPSADRDSSVGTATRYGSDGPGIEPWWGARFSAPVQTCPGDHPTSYTIGNGVSFPEVKRPGRGFDHPPPI